MTKVEKLSPLARKSAPGRLADVTSLAVVVTSCIHVPFPMVLVVEGMNLHSAELEFVEQDPVYTDISPADDMDGMNASASPVVNGRSVVRVSSVRFKRLRVEDILSDTSCVDVDPDTGRNAYATP